jgi:hypothetical protein
MLHLGGEAWPTVVILQPLFEEANRMRGNLVGVMRALAAANIASILPDLPGTGDSLVATADARLDDWRDAVTALAETLPQPSCSVAVRGGALFDGPFQHRWRLAPESGRRLLRDMIRATALTGAVKAGVLEAQAVEAPTRLAGNLVAPPLFSALSDAAPGGDAHIAAIEGAPWRRAEPDHDAAFVAAMAQDILHWLAQCGVR